MNRFILVVILIFASAQQGFCQSHGRIVDTQYFSAKVINIDKTRSGKLFVTVEFMGKMPGIRVDVTRAMADCSKSGTLLDSDGNEYGTNRCLPASGQGNGLQLFQNSTSQFVFEFTTPLANRANDRPTYSLIVPVSFQNTGGAFAYGQTTLSFFQLSAN